MVTTIFILIYFVISSESFNPVKDKNSNIRNKNHHHHYSPSTHLDKPNDIETMSFKPSPSSFKCQHHRHHRRKLHHYQNDERDDNEDEGGEDVKHYYYLSNDYKEVIKEDIVYRRERRHKHPHHDNHAKVKSFRSLPDESQLFHLNNPKHWPVKHEAVVEGDVILGGLMMVHSREDRYTCGPIMPQGGIQSLEAMLYTIDVINKMKLLPNITLGAHILDDCDKDSYGLEMAVDFIKGIYIIFFFSLFMVSRYL